MRVPLPGELRDFHYHLPEEAIAKHPVEPRRAAPVAVFESDSRAVHDTFEDLPPFGQGGRWPVGERHQGADGADPCDQVDRRPARGVSGRGFRQNHRSVPRVNGACGLKAMVRNAKRWSDGTAKASGCATNCTIAREEDAPDGGRVVRLEWTSSQGRQHVCGGLGRPRPDPAASLHA